MLEQNRIAPQTGIENADMQSAFDHQQHQRNGNHRGAEYHDEAGRIDTPDKQRHLKPGKARRSHFMDRHHKIQPGQYGGKTDNKRRRSGQDHIPV